MKRFRGNILYEPSGRALETAKFIAGDNEPIIVCNTAKSCSHMCSYCYCPTVLKMPRGDFHKKVELKHRVLEKFDKDMNKIEHMKDFNPRWIYFCFVGDPFIYGRPDLHETTNILMQRARDQGLKIITLTKGTFEFEKIQTEPVIPDWYGISLVSINEAFRQQYEPGSAKFSKRLAKAHHVFEKGARTWVSMEPCPTPNIFEQDIRPILITIRDVVKAEKLIFGRWNYDERTKGQEWEEWYIEQGWEVGNWCQENNIEVKIKDDILKRR